jgi:hypothetical protein
MMVLIVTGPDLAAWWLAAAVGVHATLANAAVVRKLRPHEAVA